MSILCLGEMLWDCMADQQADSPDQVLSWTRYPGGAPANVAIALTKLGTPSGFMGCIGEDALGDRLVQILTDAHVNRAGIQRYPAPTREVEILHLENGDRQFHQFRGRSTAEFADTYLQAAVIPSQIFAAAEFLVLGTLGLAAAATRGAIAHAVDLADRHGVEILVDVNWRPMFWQDQALAKPLIEALLAQVDFLKLAKEEAAWLFGISDPTEIHARLPHLKAVLMTDGERGCQFSVKSRADSRADLQRSGMVPAFAVAVRDTTGAGDSFVAGFLHQMHQLRRQDMDFMDLLENPELLSEVLFYASAVGALTTTKMGAIAAQPTAAEVAKFLGEARELIKTQLFL